MYTNEIRQRQSTKISRSSTSDKHSKPDYQYRWESTFGKHTARCHPASAIDAIHKSGKPTLLLITIGICASSVDTIIEYCVYYLQAWRREFISLYSDKESTIQCFLLFSISMIVLSTIGMLSTVIIDRKAAGSGIPYIKTIIATSFCGEVDKDLRFQTLIAKAIGITFACGSGISVGREGPFVHLSSIIAMHLMKYVPFFQRIYKNDILRLHMYNAASAVGVASTFRTPVGGALFAVEVTSTVFMVSNYWRAFVASLSGAIAGQFITSVIKGENPIESLMFPTKFDKKSFTYMQLALFAILGIIMGVAGATYVTFSSWFKKYYNKKSRLHPITTGIVLVGIISILLYLPGPYSQLSIHQSIFQLLSKDPLSGEWLLSWLSSYLPSLNDGQHSQSFPFILVVLMISGVIRIIVTTFSTSLMLPAGDFLPAFAAGAAFGRCYGEFAVYVLEYYEVDQRIVPGGFALVGGAAFVGSVTHTMSVAVIALECTGQFVYMMPLLLAVLLASGVGSAFSVSIYDSAIISQGFTYLPIIRPYLLEGVLAKHIMDTRFLVLSKYTTHGKLEELLYKSRKRRKSNYPIPVVENFQKMLFWGCIKKSSIETYMIEQRLQMLSHAIPMPIKVEKSDGQTPSSHKILYSLKSMKFHKELTLEAAIAYNTSTEDSGQSTLELNKNVKSLTSSTISSTSMSSSIIAASPPSEPTEGVEVVKFTLDSTLNGSMQVKEQPSTDSLTVKIQRYVKKWTLFKSNVNLDPTDLQIKAQTYPTDLDEAIQHALPQDANAYMSSASIGDLINMSEFDIDSTVFQVDEDTPIEKIHLLFELMKCSCVWVTCRGSLVGLIQRAELLHRLQHHREHAKSSIVA